MNKRLITALILIGYSALLIKVVVFKGPLRLPGWVAPGGEERVEGGRPGRGRGAPPRAGASEGRDGRGRGLAQPGPPDAQLSTSRFAPLHANFVPFKTILPQLRGQPRWSSAIMNLVGNTVLFMPVGFLALLLYREMTWRHSLVLAVGVGLTMEVLEGVFRVGVVDIDDVILNACGVMSGYWLGRMIGERRLRKAEGGRRKAENKKEEGGGK